MGTNFDRAAGFYDETRRLPPADMAAFVARLREGFGDVRRILEIGVGTGRVAVPLAEAGYDVTGVDISERMLAVLAAKGSAVRAQVADATDLPFEDDTFDGGLAVHVFHLIPDWPVAVAELVRVVRPGGRILSPWLVVEDDPLHAWHVALALAAGATDGTSPPVGAASHDAVRDALVGAGATTQDLSAIALMRTTTLGEAIDGFEGGLWSRHWRLDDEARAEAATQVRARAAAEKVDLDAEHPIRSRIELLVATL